MKNDSNKLSLDQLAVYQIKVPGHLDVSWSYLAEEMTITIEYDELGLPITILTGTFDQAALQGLLRRLYSMGLPLISVLLQGE